MEVFESNRNEVGNALVKRTWKGLVRTIELMELSLQVARYHRQRFPHFLILSE